MSTQSVADHAEAQSRRPWFRALAHAGMAARGAIFLIIGVLAVQVAADSGGQTTDQKGALAALAQQRFGEALLVILAVGLAGYALWRLAQAFLDTDDKGDDGKGWAVRASKLGSGVAYAVLCATAVGILARKLMKRLHPPAHLRGAVEWVGVVGMSARAVVFGPIAFFLTTAAVEYDPKEAVGLDGALARLAAEPYGAALLGLVAAGLVAFALHCFAEARYREV